MEDESTLKPPRPQLTLVVEKGANQGAIFPLQAGESYTIGSGLADDIFLADQALSENSVELTVDSDRVTVLCREESTTIGGQTLAPNELESFTPPIRLSLGSVVIGIASQAHGGSSDEKEGLNSEKNIDDLEQTDPDTVELSSTELTKKNTEDYAITVKTQRSAFITSASALIATVCVSLFTGMFVWGEGEGPMYVQDNDDSLLARLRKYNVEQLDVFRNPNDALVIEGYVSNEGVLGELKQLITRQEKDVINNLVGTEHLAKSVQSVLDSLALNKQLDFRVSDDGKIVFKGLLRQSKDWHVLKRTLRRDIRYIGISEESNIVFYEEVEKLVSAELNNILIYPPSVGYVDDVLVVEGVLYESELAKVKQYIVDFNEKLYEGVEFKLDATNISSPIQMDSIEAVVAGKSPYLVLKDGRNIRIGDSFDTGYRLESVGRDYLVLEKNGKNIIAEI